MVAVRLARRSKRAAMAWLLVIALGCACLLVGLYLVFVHTKNGQRVDDASLQGTSIGRAHIIDPVTKILNIVSVTALGVATITVGVVGALRKRPTLALLGMTLVAGSVATTELLKHLVFTRPLLDTTAHQLPFNTLPSGHTTVALSVAAGVTLVSPARLRALVSVIAVAYGGATGVATLSAGWHRPSDAVAACVVVAMWTALVGLLAVGLGRDGDPMTPANDSAYTVVVTLFCGLAVLLLIVGSVALLITASNIPVTFSRPRLFLAYAGGASSVAGTAFAVMAGLLMIAARARIDELDGERAETASTRGTHRMAR